MNSDRPECLDHLLTIVRRMRFLFGCFGAKDVDGDDTDPLIPEAGACVNGQAPFPLENKPASLHVREESQLSDWVYVSKEHGVVFKDVENCSKSANNNVDGDNDDMVVKDEVPFPLENKLASLHVCEDSQLSNWVYFSKEHRVVFKGVENDSQLANNNVGGDNDDMVLNDEVPFRLENKPTLSPVREEHRVVFKDVENCSPSVDNDINGDNDVTVLKDEVPYPLENKLASLHVHEEHRVVCKDVENASQYADNNVDGDNDDMVVLKDEIPFLLEKPASLHVQEGNNVDGEIDDMVVLKDEVPFLLENNPASLHVQEEYNVDGGNDYMVVHKDEGPFLLENKPASLNVHEENNVDGDNDDMVVLKDEVPFLLANEPATLHVHKESQQSNWIYLSKEHRVVFKDVENASQSRDNTVDVDNDDMVVVKVKVPLLLENEPASLHVYEEYGVVFEDVEIASQSEDNTIDGDNDDMVVLKVEAELLGLSSTLLETPAEIWKASKIMEATPDDGDDTPSKFHSSLPGTSGMKLNLEEQPDQVPTSPAQFHEEPGMLLMSENSGSPELPSSSFDVFQCPTSEVQNHKQRNCIKSPKASAFVQPGSPASPLDVPARSDSSDASPTGTLGSPVSPLEVPAHSSSSDASPTVTLESPALLLEVPDHSNSGNDSPTVTPALPTATAQGKKIVRFKCNAPVNPDDDFLPSSRPTAKSETQTCNRSDSTGIDGGRGPPLGPQHSPYPTPLKLTDEMQTPGTVYPAKPMTTAILKDARIRYQSIYPFPTSMGSLGHLEQCPEEDIEQIIDAKLELHLKACQKYTSGPAIPDESAERH